MKLKKALVALVCAAALVTATFLGTMAYFTDQDAVTNTFTVGRVGISLDEAPVDANGKATSGARVKSNTYHLIPGQTYDKDPTIHVDSDSEDCYLFVKVENGLLKDGKNIETSDSTKTIAQQMTNLKWVAVDGVESLYVYKGDSNGKQAVSKNENVKVFETFTIDGSTVVNVPNGETVPDGKVDIKSFNSVENSPAIKVTAYAIQKAGFENSTPKQIWDATFGK